MFFAKNKIPPVKGLTKNQRRLWLRITRAPNRKSIDTLVASFTNQDWRDFEMVFEMITAELIDSLDSSYIDHTTKQCLARIMYP